MVHRSELHRDQWPDVEPIEQDDGPNPLVPIAYGKDYRDAMNLFRAVIRSSDAYCQKEKAERVLYLIQDIIKMNPAHYTVWQYRQKVLFESGGHLEEELLFIDSLALDQAKNYQMWHHRRVIADKLYDLDAQPDNAVKAKQELAFIDGVLDKDSKNYHAWAYRQWVVSHFDLWEGELAYTKKLLDEDVRNNSAWNHRHFVLFPGSLSNRPAPTPEELKVELEFTRNYVMKARNNPSSWAYLSGLLEKTTSPLEQLKQLLPDIMDPPVSQYAYALLVDLYEQEAARTKTGVPKEALEMCDTLAKYDDIRKKYWCYRKTRLESLIVAQ